MTIPQAQNDDERARIALVAEKHAQARELLRRFDLDCWLTFTREGSDPLLPFVTGAEYLVGTSALMIFADGPSVAIVADYDRGQVDGVFDLVHAYGLDWHEPFRDVLTDRAPGRIAINTSRDDHGIDGLTHGLWLLLRDALEPLGMTDRLVSAEEVAGRVRALKTPAEVERIRRSCDITVRIFDDLTGMLRPGLTETDVHAILVERMQAHEVGPAWEASYCPSVTTSRGVGGHAAPGLVAIEPGDALRVDFGVRHEGYCSDLQRTWYFPSASDPRPPAAIARPFEAVRDGIALAAELLAPGMSGVEVDSPVRSLLAERGFTFTHALGHQLGRLCHDGGMVLGPDNARYRDRSRGTVEAGMVFTLEPCVGPIGLEEDVLVTDRGVEFLVPAQRELIIVS